VLGQTVAELATQGQDPNGSQEISFGSQDSNFPGINIPKIDQHGMIMCYREPLMWWNFDDIWSWLLTLGTLLFSYFLMSKLPIAWKVELVRFDFDSVLRDNVSCGVALSRIKVGILDSDFWAWELKLMAAHSFILSLTRFNLLCALCIFRQVIVVWNGDTSLCCVLLYLPGYRLKVIYWLIKWWTHAMMITFN